MCKIEEESKSRISFTLYDRLGKIWVTSYLANRTNVNWKDFKWDLAARFKDDSRDNVVEQFNKLTQLDSLEEYIDSFEELRAILIQHGHQLSSAYLL